MTTKIRVGQGFDIHRFVEASDNDRKLILGGVHFVNERGLIGHSDADVIAHAEPRQFLAHVDSATSANTFPTQIQNGGTPTR